MKYDGMRGWAMIFGRLVVGWLEANAVPATYDLIVVNPTHKDREPVRHTELMLEYALLEDELDRWAFDDPADPALVKTHETTQSAKGNWYQKRDAAAEHAASLEVRHRARFEGANVLVVDDVTTTLHQLNQIARLLKKHGAARVDGLVVARAIR